MSVADVTSRISQIQAQLALLGRPAGSTSSTRASPARSTPRPAATPTDDRDRRHGEGDAVVGGAAQVPRRPLRLGRHRPGEGAGLLRARAEGLLRARLRPAPGLLPSRRRPGARSPAWPRPSPATRWPSARRSHHVAIYVGDHQMIEAPRPGQDVQLSPVYETPTAIRRIVPDARRRPVGAVGGVGTAGRVDAGTPYASLFEGAAAKYGVGADLLSAVAKQESGYNPRATSPAGAQGLMQLMPATARGLGVTNSFDPAQAVDGAARLLSSLLDRFGSTRSRSRRTTPARARCSSTTASRRTPRPRTTSAPSCRRWRQHEPPRRS